MLWKVKSNSIHQDRMNSAQISLFDLRIPECNKIYSINELIWGAVKFDSGHYSTLEVWLLKSFSADLKANSEFYLTRVTSSLFSDNSILYRFPYSKSMINGALLLS